MRVLKPLLFVILLGSALGLMIPAPPPAATEPAPAPEAAKADRPDQATFARASVPPRETRVDRSPDGHFYVSALVNGQRVRFLVDTGATSVALTEADARRVGAGFSPAEYRVVGTGASGMVRGQQISLDRIELDGKKVSQVNGAVIEGLHISLLGQAFLSRMEMVQMSAGEMIIR